MATFINIGDRSINLDLVTEVRFDVSDVPHRKDDEYEDVVKVCYAAPAVPPVDGVTQASSFFFDQKAQRISKALRGSKGHGEAVRLAAGRVTQEA